MKYYIFSDIHGNLEAFSAFLRLTDPLREVQRYCLGDVVGYGSSPNECVEMLSDRRIPVVMGNHDYAILHPEERRGFNFEAREAIEWQESVLQEKNRSRIETYPFVKRVPELFSLTHSNFCIPADFTYLLYSHQASSSFSALKTPLGFFGHTHVPTVFTEDPLKRAEKKISCEYIRGNHHKLHIDPGKRYLINPGSLGQPRDRNPQAAYAVFDSDEMIVEFFRIPYDCQAESERMRRVGLPDNLSKRILTGN